MLLNLDFGLIKCNKIVEVSQEEVMLLFNQNKIDHAVGYV